MTSVGAPAKTVTGDARTDPRWGRLVADRATTVFHSPAWLDVLGETYGFPIHARMVIDGSGEPTAGIVYAELRDFLDSRLVGLPFSDFCDPIAASAGEWRQLIDDVVAAGLRIDLRCLHNDVPLDDERFTVTGRAKWHAIDVRRQTDEIWAGLDGSARRAIRKAQSDGVTVKRAEGEADLRAFFELHLRVRKLKYGLLAQPYAFFTNIWEHFIEPGRGVLLLAMRDGSVIGGVLFLGWQGALYYKFNASDGAHLSSRPNDRVIWEGIVHAREAGFDRIDFGLSDEEQHGLVRYKRKYATEERTISLLRHVPGGLPTQGDALGRRMLHDITRLFVDESVPDELSERAGQILYRFFA